jgi:cell division protein ZapD
LSESEWLNAIRGRIGIPAGTCSFDMPAYHRWRQLPAAHRRVHLEAWAAHFKPMSDALRLLLGMLRDNAETVSVVAVGGQFQQPLPQGRSYQLLRIELPQDRDDAVPEISANRLLVNVRWALLQDDLRCVADGRDIHFTLSLCN